jgi:hypothetical protein
MRVYQHTFSNGLTLLAEHMGMYIEWPHIDGRLYRARTAFPVFVNRAAPWLRVESHLPYEGKVLLPLQFDDKRPVPPESQDRRQQHRVRTRNPAVQHIPQNRDVQSLDLPFSLANRKRIQQCLCRMLVRPITRVDDA